jgi:uncharacterized membrane protein (DUF2068 family)
MRSRILPVTLAVVLLALGFLLSLISSLLPTDYPTIVIYLGVVLGVAGLVVAAGLWALRRWGLWLTIVVSALNIMLAAPGVVVEPDAVGRVFAAVQLVVPVLILVLVMRPASRRTFAAP